MFRYLFFSKHLLSNINSKSFYTGADVRRVFLDYFETQHGHKLIKSSPVVPLCDPTVPFVNAGMNQFKSIFLGHCNAPHPRVVNSQKCIRVGGKHNDLGVVGTDGHHHTFFEMLGNWSFGDYYKKEACEMAWGLLTGPFGLKPDELIVTYFEGSKELKLEEDLETKDIWKSIGLKDRQIMARGMADNFWEMGSMGPCGPCTEIHHLNPDGTITEIWNLVFMEYNRDADGSIRLLPRKHVDTGMGLERVTALLQNVRSNYDTDLFLPIIKTIEQQARGAAPYGGRLGPAASTDCAYRCLADHARMMSVCLADGLFPDCSVNLKQIMRKALRLSTDVFGCETRLLSQLYDRVADTLGQAYPELMVRRLDAHRVIEHEEDSYLRLRKDLEKRWKSLACLHPEIEKLGYVEMPGFFEGYKQLKKAMSTHKSNEIPGDIVFKLYDAHGFQLDFIDKIATLNNYSIDKDGFQILLNRHLSKHKAAFKELTNSDRTSNFETAMDKLNQNGVTKTNDEFKYDYEKVHNKIKISPHKSRLVAFLDESATWKDITHVENNDNYYLVTENTNFYCESGGQAEDTGIILINDDCYFNVASVFKIKDIVFHKGSFVVSPNVAKVKIMLDDSVVLKVNAERRLNLMRNHTATHLLNAALRAVLPDSVIYQVGSKVTDSGLVLNLAVYGDKLSQSVLTEAQGLIRRAVTDDVKVETRTIDSLSLSQMPEVLTVPGETYPETGLRLVHIKGDLLSSRELCCGTHVVSTGDIGAFCITGVRGAGGNTPSVRAVTGDAATQMVALTQRAYNLQATAPQLGQQRLRDEMAHMRRCVSALAGGAGGGGARGRPAGEHAACLRALHALDAQIQNRHQINLNAVAEIEMREIASECAALGRPFAVHFLVCSYLMERPELGAALAPCAHLPAMLFGCANGVIVAACQIPKNAVTKDFTAEKWLSCVLPIFKADIAHNKTNRPRVDYAAMTGTKVSLINCESLVHDAMKVAIAYAKQHTRNKDSMPPDVQARRSNT